MSLQLWLPLNKDIKNYGIANATITVPTNATIVDGGKVGKCLLSSTASDYIISVTVPGLQDMLANGKKYTLCCWVKIQGRSLNDWAIKLGSNTCGLWWGYSPTRWVWNENDNGKYAVDNTTSGDTSNWHHLAMVVDKSVSGQITLYRYLDGVPTSGDVPASITWDNSSQSQPSGNTVYIYPWVAKMNDIRLYDDALSPKEIKEISKGLAVHYTLSGGAQNNLISGTMDIPTTNAAWGIGSGSTKSGTVGSFSKVALTGTTANWNSYLRCTPIRYKLVRNYQVTFSFYAKATAECNCTLEWSLSHKATPISRAKYITERIVIGTNWKRYITTHTISDSFFVNDNTSGETIVPDTDFMYLNLYNHVDNTELYTYGWKLEYGSVATPWKPHPNDSQYMAMGQFTGNRNLLLDSRKGAGVFKGTYDVGDYNLSESLVEGKTYTISAKINSSGKQSYAFCLSGGSIVLDPAWHLIGNTDGYCVGIFTATNAQATNTAGSGHGFVRVYLSNNAGAYQGSTTVTGTASVEWIKLEEGNIATGWVPNVQDSGYADKMFEYDVSGFGYNAIRYGSMKISSSTPKYITSTVFGGATSDYIQMPQPTYRNIIGSTEAVTASIWARRSSWTTPSTIQMFFSCQEAGGFIIRMNSNGNFDFAVGTGASSNTYKSSVGSKTIPNYGFAANSWHMFTITYDGLVLKFYIDGVLDKTVSSYSTKTPIYYQTNTMLFIGAEAGANTIDPNYMFTGNLSDFRWYTTALSADDILELYNTSASIASNGVMLANEFVE